MAAVGGVYTAMWNAYLNTELLFTSTSNFVDLNDQAFQFWDFSHTDPTGAVQKPDSQGNPTLYTAGDLAATMAANPDLLVLSANGYFDSVTPFYQTKLTLDAMPLQNAAARANLTIRNYPSGHMVYLDGNSRTALKADLATLYDRATHAVAARLTGWLRPCDRSGRRSIPISSSKARPARSAPPLSAPNLGSRRPLRRLFLAHGPRGRRRDRDPRVRRRVAAVRHRRLFREGQPSEADHRRRADRRGRQCAEPRRRSFDQPGRRGGPRHPSRRGRLQRRDRTARDDPRLLGGRERLGVDGDSDLGGGGRRVRRLLHLLGHGRGQLAGSPDRRREWTSPAN